jgi:very-short-patch-repair endonuclease
MPSKNHVQRTAEVRNARRRRIERIAADQHGIVSRRQVYAAELTRGEVQANVRAGRWQRTGRQTLAVHNGPLTDRAREWVAVLEAGPRACLDGASSLVAAGLEGFNVGSIRVSVPRGNLVLRIPGVDIRQTRRLVKDDVVGVGIPRTRNEVAAVRGAIWARSDKQAALLLTMVVQQGFAPADRIGLQMLRIKRDRRRAFIHSVILDLLGGVRSLGELDVARECRRRGLPEPGRQVVRKGANGRYYLDLCWDDWGVVVEVDGIQHSWASQVVPDALRQNDVTLTDAKVLRMPLLGFRVAQDDFFAQIERALVQQGCPLGSGSAA